MNMKKLIESMDHIEECGMTEDPMPTTMPGADAGQPVSMNVSINASGKDHVADLIDMMKNAGMSTAAPVSSPSLGMRGDMEKFRSAMDDDPEIPGDDDNPDDTDLKAGIIGALGGAAAGAAIPGASAATGSLGSMAGGALGSLAGPAGTAIGSKIGGAVGAAVPTVVGSKIGDKLTGEELATEDDLEEYANEPDPQYGDMSDAIPDGNDLNRKKKAYPATQDGDNPMAVEAIKAQLMAALSEKKAKPDFLDMDKDGDKKEPMKKAAKDKKSKGIKAMVDAGNKKADAEAKGSKPKKGVVPPQFKKKGTDESGQTKDCPKCGAPGKKKLMACSSCGCS